MAWSDPASSKPPKPNHYSSTFPNSPGWTNIVSGTNIGGRSFGWLEVSRLLIQFWHKLAITGDKIEKSSQALRLMSLQELQNVVYLLQFLILDIVSIISMVRFY